VQIFDFVITFSSGFWKLAKNRCNWTRGWGYVLWFVENSWSKVHHLAKSYPPPVGFFLSERENHTTLFYTVIGSRLQPQEHQSVSQSLRLWAQRAKKSENPFPGNPPKELETGHYGYGFVNLSCHGLAIYGYNSVISSANEWANLGVKRISLGHLWKDAKF
jgi:hypothetical protein